MNKLELIDIGIRVVKTFIQGTLGAMAVNIPKSDMKNKAVLRSLVVGGVSAGVCAVMNLLIDLLK